jgi:hypothetical protein
VAILLCGLHAWVARHAMNRDGVSYLDLADACARGGLGSAVNSYWSPLYPWLVGATFRLVRPSAYWECAVVHAVNFVIFLGALAAFECLLSELLRARRGDGGRGALPEWALIGLAYALFAWTSRRLITLAVVTPDMGVAALVYLAGALLLRARRAGPARWTSALLGVVLGAAYLAKAVMFPLSFVFLGVSVPAGKTWRKAAGHVALASACCLVVAGSFVAVLSSAKGRLTFGDAGRLNYAWYVCEVPRLHWLGGGDGMPAHPPRKVFPSPAVYEFAAPLACTYPLWYDPPYWYEGVEVQVAVRKQLAASARTARDYLRLLGKELGLYTVLVVVLHLLALAGGTGPWRERFGSCLAGLARQYPLLVPALAAGGLYLLVGHVEGRLIGPFLVLLLVGALAAVRGGVGAVRVAGCFLGLSSLALAALLLNDAHDACLALAGGEGAAAHPAWGVANYLKHRGIKAGAGVGHVGYDFDAYWARLGGYRIVAEVSHDEAAKFWGADRAVREQAIAALQRAGARAVVADQVPPAGEGWVGIPGTRYFLYDPGKDEEDVSPRYAARGAGGR